jgi:enamine deaminase RidA (YjgF/YER057c/UK114 family)
MDNILARIHTSLRDAGSCWDKVARISFYLHRSQEVEKLNRIFAKHVKAKVPQRDYSFVDGYSSAGKLCEIEVTASL